LTGLEVLLASSHPWIEGQRLGLLCNPASVAQDLSHARQLIDARFPHQLKALYSPQHGFFAEKQDNMVESADLTDPVTGCPVFSLYGTTRVPTAAMLAPIDVLLVDLQDVGTRVYTFIYTLAYCMEAAARHNRRVLILDRPNPIGGLAVEGNLLRTAWASFVGRYPLPMRHGLTIGELARLFTIQEGIDCELDVISMQGWRRNMDFRATRLPWVAPSPNMPTPETALVYPGQVIWEGTNLSEGRGTTQPFELCGAPYLDPVRIAARLADAPIPGAAFRSCLFEPTSGKHAGCACRGFQIHVTDARQYQPYLTSLRLLQAIIAIHPDVFAWKPPPYEYEFEKWPIDLILGDGDLRCGIERMEDLAVLQAGWQAELADYHQRSRALWLYA